MLKKPVLAAAMILGISFILVSCRTSGAGMDKSASEESADEILNGIACWGDSLTYGYNGDGTSYPAVLQSSISANISKAIKVVNLGACGEDSITIAGRNGGIPYTAAEDTVIKKNTSEDLILKIRSKSGKAVSPSLYNDIGINPCHIDGVEGTLSIAETGNPDSDYIFRRKSPGSEVNVTDGDQIVTAASEEYRNYYPLIFIGTNGGYDDYDDLIEQQNSMITEDQRKSGHFLIIGITCGSDEEMSDYDNVMEKEYGENYFNLRSYMVNNGLQAAGISADSHDEKNIAAGIVPHSLRSDDVHFNKTGYEVAGKAIYMKLVSLGWFSEISGCTVSSADVSDFFETSDQISANSSKDAFNFAGQLCAGINIGNSLDAYGNLSADNIYEYETYWKNPVITQNLMKLISKSGFKTVRVPVTWEGHLSEDNTIDPEWLNRVRQVVDYAYNEGLYVIIDVHHDKWDIPTYDNEKNALYMTDKIWGQIAQYFCNYDDHLIFEGFNEPRLIGTDEEWRDGTDEAYDVINSMVAEYVKTVRNTGGYNKTRYLLISTYRNGDMYEMLQKLEIPDDDHLLVSVHAYIPYEFAQKRNGTDAWSSENEEDTDQIDTIFLGLKGFMDTKNIPVVITEFAAVNKNNEEDRADWCRYYTRTADKYGIPYIWWDNNYPAAANEEYALLDRKNCTIVHQDLVDILTGQEEK